MGRKRQGTRQEEECGCVEYGGMKGVTTLVGSFHRDRESGREEVKIVRM